MRFVRRTDRAGDVSFIWGVPDSMALPDRSKSQNVAEPNQALPSLALPKGGGAIRGIGEKLAANPVTGTGSLSVPIATSPGRSGFGPELALAYDSGSGNGAFGLGWSLSLPAISRKTDKGLPRYRDAEDSDVFLLSGAEDLVPEFAKDATGEWVIREGKHVLHERLRTVGGIEFTVRRYRPRTEGTFARIERWTRRSDGGVHWRSITRDNVLTLYGVDGDSRIADSEDPSRVFTWLISETRDDKGNAVLYGYKAEDGAGVDLARPHERNRGSRNDPRRATNRYIKRIRYGNRQPLLDDAGERPVFLDAGQVQNAGWMFEVVFDYGEHHAAVPAPDDAGEWSYRSDPFSSYRSGFEVRCTRLCRRVLSFHHFQDEVDVGRDCLVRSTDFTYSDERDRIRDRAPVYTFLRAVSQIGYRRTHDGYERRSLPPLEFEYTQPVVQDRLEEVDAASLENLPIGVDGNAYQWTDLHGEGVPGILAEQAGAWFYKRNLSPLGGRPVQFAPLERVVTKPSLALASGGAQFMDLAGDGQPDVVVLDGPCPGLFEHDEAEGWQPFRPFASRLDRDLRDPNLKFVDLDGDGHADVLITEDDALVWHPSLAEEGFGPGNRVARALDEEQGPRVVFDDGTQSIHLADLSGDGLTDLVRIRNGEVCYWPNLGYGRFGAKIAMDHAPLFDHPDQFDHRRLRLADVDGSGTTDIVYLHRDGVRIYFNQSGNGWSQPRVLQAFARIDDAASIVPTDLLGNGTACLVWSSSLPGDARRPMRFVNLMGGSKPHLLVRVANNLGAETHVEYAPSTRFYLQDKREGRAWLARLPFPVHVVERVETYDRVSRNRFVTRYAYHHGHFDGEEREFRGFGMVEQWDTEEIAALVGDATATNSGRASHVPPVHTKTWFHTGAHLGREHVSDAFAGLLDAADQGEYYREPGLSDAEARALLLPDTVLPAGLTLEEEREACRALRGSMLRQEVYADDAPPGSSEEAIRRSRTPYTVVERNFGVRLEQPRGRNRHAVFLTHSREVITYHYERDFADPRIQHALTLEVDPYGNVLREVAIGYGRRRPDPRLPTQSDRDKQTRALFTYTESRFTNAIDDLAAHPNDHRTPLPAETRTYELTGLEPEGGAERFRFDEWVRDGFALAIGANEIPYEQEADGVTQQRRLIEHVRTLYRPDDLGASQGDDPRTLLPLGVVERRALAGEGYKLAFTPGLLARVFERGGQPLLPDPAAVLGGAGADQGGYLPSQQLKAGGSFPGTDLDDHWWVPAGRAFLSPDGAHTAAQELAHARRHFSLPLRVRDPFGQTSSVRYDAYDLLVLETRDALDNRVTVGERLANGGVDASRPGNDYRVLQPWRVMDANRNRALVAFDALGMVVGTAVAGKPEENLGDSLDGFVADLAEAVILDSLADPLAAPQAILGRATTRLVHDLFAYQRTRNEAEPRPAVVYTLARETHDADLEPGSQTRFQHAFSYSDGFGREIQKKVQAEPGPLAVGGPDVGPRWVGSGWTIFNNKGKPVRQYEPFFSATHRFEFGVQVGVSPILFYDPVERVVATLHPNRTYEKVIFGAWSQRTWDVNDTVLGDPRIDADIGATTAAYFAGLPPSPPALPWQTWYAERRDGDLGAEQRSAADKAAAHADTPTTTHFDALGRTFLTLAHNRVVCANHPLDGTEEEFATRVELDVEGNQRSVRDAVKEARDALGTPVQDELGRIVMRYAYDMLGSRVFQLSMEAGARWTLADALGKPIRAWDSRGHGFRTAYDALRRPLRSFVTGAVDADPNEELLTERLVYGEQHPEDELRALRGRLYLHLDQAGTVSTEAHDFKGNPLRASRRIAIEYKRAIDWSAVDGVLPAASSAKLDLALLEAVLAPLLEADVYASSTSYDALNRPVALVMPHTPAMKPSIIRHSYNEANLVERTDANLGGATASGQPAWTPFVTNVDYDAKGQPQRIDYGNGASTLYEYDPLTFRLVHLVTRRNPVAFQDDCPQPSPAGWPGCRVQNLHYTYDPAGNVTRIRDDAQQLLFFRNKRVEPSAEYTYDALHRLIEATGREHLGQSAGVGNAPTPHSHDDAPRVGIEWSSNDGNAMGTYVERYVYDAVGNFLEVRHRGSDPAHAGWTRTFAYGEASLIEDGTGGTLEKLSNRLSSTTVGNGVPSSERYAHDAHGNMVRMPHFGGAHPDANMHWDHRDRLLRIDLGGGGTAYYTYDAPGQRVRKVWEKSPGLTEERIYLGGFEIFRKHGGPIGASTVMQERETLHVMDDKQRIALVETRTLDTAGDDQAPRQLIRYQLGNHLGSASLELDEGSRIISYEEYAPYGSSTYQAVRSLTETAKRYRYTGKERDEESGLHYHGQRYSVSWLGRWSACDPTMLNDGVNLYQYSRCNPVLLVDPDGTQSVISSELDTTDPLSFTSYDDYRSANPGQPEEAVRDVWYAAHGKKYLIIYDKGNGEFKRQALQAARDHRTKAHSVGSSKLSELVAEARPDVIMSFGHGIEDEMSVGDNEWIGFQTLRRELKQASQSQDIRFVAQACSCGKSGGLMDKLDADPDLKNYSFVSHMDSGHVTRNSSIRVAGGESLPAFLRKETEAYYRTSPSATTRIVHKLLAANSEKENSPDSDINTVIRETSVLGFDKFWTLLSGNANPRTDRDVLSLNLSSEALERFSKGIEQLRSRFSAAVSKEKTDTSPRKRHLTEIR